MPATLEYGHWGITVSERNNINDYAPHNTTLYSYPIGTRGPIDDADTERLAIAHCRRLGGTIKGPFFYKEC